MQFIQITPTLLTALLLFSCSTEKTDNMQSASAKIELSQIQRQWVLLSIDGQSVDTAISSTLLIAAPDKATGKLACNHFFGALKLQENKFKIDKMGSTRKICQQKINDLEAMVAATLSDWSRILLKGNKLTLIGNSHSLNYQSKP